MEGPQYISVEFNEAKYLAIGIVNWLQLAVLALPTLLLIDTSAPSASYFLETSFYLAMICSMQCVLFVPIFMQVQKQHRQSQETRPMVTYTLPTRGATHVSVAPNKSDEEAHPSSCGGAGRTSASQSSAHCEKLDTIEDLKKRNTELERRIKQLESRIIDDTEAGSLE